MPHRGNNRSWEDEVLQDWDLARETEGEDEREEEVEYKSKDKKTLRSSYVIPHFRLFLASLVSFGTTVLLLSPLLFYSLSMPAWIYLHIECYP